MAIGIDRVQVSKSESSAQGGNDADNGDYGEPVPISPQEDALESAGIYLQDALNRDENVYIERDGNDLRFRDVSNPSPVTLTQLLSTGSGGITEPQHQNLDTLVHNLAENSYSEVLYDAQLKVTDHIIWTSSAKTTKIRECNLTYDPNGLVTQVVSIQYDVSGIEVHRVTKTISYVSGTSRVSSISSVFT